MMKDRHLPNFLLYFFIVLPLATIYSQERELYILNRGANNILSIPLDSPNANLSEKFNQGIVATFDIISEPDSGKLFWTSRFPNQLNSGRQNSNGVTAVNYDASPIDIEIDFQHSKVYWADHQRGKVCRSNLNGTQIEHLNQDSLPNLSSLAVFISANQLFFADLDSAAIWSSTLEGLNRQVLLKDTLGYPVRLAVDTIQQKLYWSDDGRHRIERINLNGTDREIFYEGAENELPFGLYIDQPSGHIYWTDYGENKIMKGELTSKNVSTVIENGLNDPIAITIAAPFIESRSIDRERTDLQQPKISVYPNPANESLTFSSIYRQYDIKQIRIFDNIGKPVYIKDVNETFSRINISGIQEGYYSYVVFIENILISGHFSIIH